MRRVMMYGKVIVKQDDEILFECKNDILTNGYRWLCSMWLCESIGSVNIGSKLFTIRAGTGNTPNNHSTTTLETPITIAPSTAFGTGVVRIGTRCETKFMASWPSGILNTQLGELEKIEELGLYFGMCNNQTARWTNATWGQDVFSRVVLEDNAFVPDPTRPVIVEWIIGVDFV